MNSEEKIQYVKNEIDEKTKISPKGSIHLKLYNVSHPDNEEWTILTIGEQMSIIRKLKEDGYIKNVVMDEEKRGFWLEKVVQRKKSRAHNLLGQIPSSKDFATGNEKINFILITNEQAIFLTKIIVNHIYRILDAVSTGFVYMTDEQLNAKYIILSNNLKELLSRSDLSETKEKLPDYLPENLFESLADMGIWWSEGGGNSEILTFIGAIEGVWVLAGQHTFSLPAWFFQFLNDTDLAITKHRKDKIEYWNYRSKKIDEYIKNNDLKDGEAKENKVPTKVFHEHKHFFENSIQEKELDINIEHKKEGPESYYITKVDDDFYYKGKYLDISKKADPYKVFNALYVKLQKGGEITYKEFGEEIKSRIPKTKNMTSDEMQKFIQRNLTDRTNGFLKCAKIPESEDNGKPLIRIERNTGIVFNNKVG